MVAVVCFALSTSLFKLMTRSSEGLTALMGRRVFLPHYISYKWTVIGLVALLFVYYLAAAWNEETDKFTIEM